MDVVSDLRQHCVPILTGLAVAVGLGTALVTGAGVAQAQPDHHDPSGGGSSNTSSSSNSPTGSASTTGRASSGNRHGSASSTAPRSNSPSESAPTTRKAPLGNQRGAAFSTARRSDAGSKESGFDARTTTGTTPPGNGLQRRTLKPSKPLRLSSVLSPARVSNSHTSNTSSLSSVAPNLTAATTPATVGHATKPEVRWQAAVTPTALSRTSTHPPRLLTRLLGLAGPGTSAVPKTPTPVDNPLGWAMMGVVRRFGQLVSNAEETRLAQPGVTTSLTTANAAADPPAPQAAAAIDRTFVIFNTSKHEVYISGYPETNGITGLPAPLTSIAPGGNLSIDVPYRPFQKNEVKVTLYSIGASPNVTYTVTLDVGSIAPLKNATCDGPCRVTNLFGDIVLNDSPPRTGPPPSGPPPTSGRPNYFEQLVELIRDALGRDHHFGHGTGIKWLAKAFGIV